MSRKLVCIADAHVHNWRLCSRDGGHDRLMDGLSVVRQSLELARTLGAVWVFAGDMKQPKHSWPQSALTGLHALFREYRDEVEMVLVAGNHDAEGEGGSGLAPFRDVGTVVEVPTVVTTKAGALVCCPWNGDPTVAAQMLAAQPDRRVLIAHGFLAGCLLGPEDTRIAKGLALEDYGAFDLAIFGDVHKTQWRVPGDPAKARAPTWVPLTAETGETVVPRGSVIYAGSPMALNWGERNDPDKGALVIDLDAGTARLEPLQAPRYRHLELTEEGLDRFLGGEWKGYVGDFVRIVYTGPVLTATTQAIDEVRDSFRSFQFIARKPEPTVRRAEVHAGMSTPEILRQYVEARPPEGDPARALEAGLRLVEVME